MKNSLKLASTVALLALFGGTFNQPANAFDFMSILQDLSGGISGWNELDTREAEMNTQITAAASSGQLTATEANGFKLEMARIAQIEAQIKASGRRLSTTDSISFTNTLNNLATRIQASIDSKTTVNTASLKDVDTLRAQLTKQINDATSAGSLTQTDAANIQHDLDHNANIESAFTASGDGAVTARQVQLLSDDLKKIKVSIDQQLKVARSAVPQLNAQRLAVEQKIAGSLSAGTLTAYQVADFRRELARIAGMQSSFVASDGGLSGNEVLTLASELDRLSDRIDSQIALAPAQPVTIPGQSSAAIDARQAQLTRRIDESLSAGRISAQTAADWKHELQHIAMIEAAFQSNPAGLNAAQVQQLSAELDEMNARIDQQTLATQIPVQTLPTISVDLDTRLKQVRKRITDAIPQGKVTQQEANQLYSDLDQITDNVQSVQDDSGNISDEDKLALQGDLDRVSYRVEQLLRMRRMGLAQIDSRRAQLLNRINEGQSSGKLSRLEASLLKREYNRITRNETQFKALAGGALNYNQSARLWADLTQLDQLLTNEINARASGSASYR